MEPYNQYPVTGAARVRSDPSCAGQARGRAGPNILIDRCETQVGGYPICAPGDPSNRTKIGELFRNKNNEALFSCKYIHVRSYK